MPNVALLDAVIAIVLATPVVERLAPKEKPLPPLPWPKMEDVAVIFPVVVNPLPVKLMPLPPLPADALVPPMQFINTTSLTPVYVDDKANPLFAGLLPPMQPETDTVPSVMVEPNVTVPDVPGVQGC